MKDIKLRIKSVESTMQITKAMELVASSKMRRAKERVEHSRPYFETLHETLTKIAAADPRARNPYLRRDEVKRTLRTVGDKWSYLQASKFGANAQPFYVAIDNDGNPLAAAFSFKEDVSAYLDFLNKGLDNYRNK